MLYVCAYCIALIGFTLCSFQVLSQPILASSYTVDSTGPELDQFSFDMDAGVLSLTFDEVVDYTTIDLYSSRWRLIKGPGSGDRLELRNGGIFVPPGNWYILNIQLVESDFDDLRELSNVFGIYSDVNSTFLSFFQGGFFDVAGNPSLQDATNPIQARDYTPDLTQPVLVAFNFSINGSQPYLSLSFSELVDLNTLNFSLVELHNAAHVNGSTEWRALSGGRFPSPPPPVDLRSRAFTLLLIQDDVNAIKALRDLGTDVNNTYLIFREGAILDLFYLPNSEEDGYTVQATSVIADRTPPELNSFTLDLDGGLIILTFSETVEAASFDPTALSLQSAASGSALVYTLRGGSVVSLEDTPYITLELTPADLNAVKAIRGLATNRDDTYLSLAMGGVQDIVGLNVTAVTADGALLADNYTTDQTPPIIMGVSLNLTTNELILTFDETISALASDVIVERISIKPDGNDTTIGVSLTSSSQVVSNDSIIIVIQLGAMDLNRIKLNTGLATDSSNTFVTVERNAFTDMSTNRNGNLEQTLLVDELEEDLVSPSLSSWSFDLNQGCIQLRFDEPVDVTTLNVQGLTLLDNATGSVMFTLTDAYTNSSNGTLLKLFILDEDLNSIKQNETLLTALSNAYLSLDSTFIQDTNGQPLTPVMAQQAAAFINDTSRPYLVQYDLDMDTGRLRLEFSETVDILSFNPAGITFQPEMVLASDAVQYTLTRGELLTVGDEVVLTLQLSAEDLNAIKARMIGLGNGTTWLLLDNTTVQDQSGEKVLPAGPVPVDLLTLDTTPPQLESFVLDYTNETITLVFSETVNSMTMDVTQITLHSAASNTSSSYTLSSRSVPDRVYAPEVTVNLSSFDLNELKRRLDLATSPTNTFISFTAQLVSDVAGNPVQPLTPGKQCCSTNAIAQLVAFSCVFNVFVSAVLCLCDCMCYACLC